MANEIARKLRKNMARHEVRLQLRLRELRKLGFHFRRQASIKSFVVDFACYHPRVVVELDGSQYSRRRQELKDAARDLALGTDDFRIIACGMRRWKRI
jgi:very-short-patch-repair endonuclease